MNQSIKVWYCDVADAPWPLLVCGASSAQVAAQIACDEMVGPVYDWLVHVGLTDITEWEWTCQTIPYKKGIAPIGSEWIRVNP